MESSDEEESEEESSEEESTEYESSSEGMTDSDSETEYPEQVSGLLAAIVFALLGSVCQVWADTVWRGSMISTPSSNLCKCDLWPLRQGPAFEVEVSLDWRSEPSATPAIWEAEPPSDVGWKQVCGKYVRCGGFRLGRTIVSFLLSQLVCADCIYPPTDR